MQPWQLSATELAARIAARDASRREVVEAAHELEERLGIITPIEPR